MMTRRQREVLASYVRWGRVTAVARDLGLSPSTVKEHLLACKERLGARTPTHAVVLAWSHGLINLPAPVQTWRPGHRESQ